MSWVRTVAWFIALVYSTIPLFWLVAHNKARHWRRPRKAFQVLLPCWLVFITIAGALTWSWRDTVLFSSPLVVVGGILLLFVGHSIYVASAKHFSWKQLSGAPEFEAQRSSEQRLVVSGLHAHVRHPIYLAHFLNLLGWMLISGLAAVTALLAFAIITGAVMIRFEEKELLARFGEEYRSYQRRVPAILPSGRIVNKPSGQ